MSRHSLRGPRGGSRVATRVLFGSRGATAKAEVARSKMVERPEMGRAAGEGWRAEI